MDPKRNGVLLSLNEADLITMCFRVRKLCCSAFGRAAS